eukprot:957183-Rhodomonas_salina.1
MERFLELARALFLWALRTAIMHGGDRASGHITTLQVMSRRGERQGIAMRMSVTLSPDSNLLHHKVSEGYGLRPKSNTRNDSPGPESTGSMRSCVCVRAFDFAAYCGTAVPLNGSPTAPYSPPLPSQTHDPSPPPSPPSTPPTPPPPSSKTTSSSSSSSSSSASSLFDSPQASSRRVAGGAPAP